MRHLPSKCAPVNRSTIAAQGQGIILTLIALVWLAPFAGFGCSRAPAYQSMNIAQLIELLDDPDAARRIQGAYALGQKGAEASPAVPRLIKLLDDENVRLRQTTAVALGQIGPPASAAVPALTKRLSDPDVIVRRQSAAALGRIGARPALPALRKAQRDPARIVREAATESIQWIEAIELIDRESR